MGSVGNFAVRFEFFFYAVWALASVGLAIASGFLTHAVQTELEVKLDKCIAESSVELLQSIDGKLADAAAVNNFNEVTDWIQDAARRAIDTQYATQPLKRAVLESIASDVLNNTFSATTKVGQVINDAKMQIYTDIHAVAEVVESEINVVMHTIIDVLQYILIAYLVSLGVCLLATATHVVMVGYSNVYRIAVHGGRMPRSAPSGSLALSIVVRYVIMLTVVICGAVAAALLLIEKYVLREVPEIKPLIACRLDSHLEQYGLPAAVLAATLIVGLFVEVVAIHDVTYGKDDCNQGQELMPLKDRQPAY